MPDAISMPPAIDFGLKIDFQANTPDPSRVFRAMTGLIEACQAIDLDLAKSISAQANPVLLLEDIRTGSLTAFLRSTLQSIDDEALRTLDWRQIVGAYLVKGKRVMVDFLRDRGTINSREEIYDLERVLSEAARETGALRLPSYSPLPAGRLAESVRILSDATAPLALNDRAIYLSSDGESDINTSFRVTPEVIEEVLTEQTLVSEREMILKVKRPDFLGEAMWEFRFQGRKISAKVLHAEWLQSFHRGTVTLHPGDALYGVVRETVKYGFDREVIATHYEVVRVLQVIPREEPAITRDGRS
ncbi:MAG: hypothetical protein M1541_04865 [Acidobacteria bacterium]|nr:hypothetical protein [Acidobacteriota bacterium]